MNKKIFISHSTRDKEIARIIEEVIEKISGGLIKAWYSSDERPGRGLGFGNWINDIFSKIRDCDIFIMLLTPNSCNSQWVLFETGYASAIGNDFICPLRFNLEIDKVPDCIKYTQQIYSISPGEGNEKYKDIHDFLGKLMNKLGGVYDRETNSETVRRLFSEIGKVQNENTEIMTKDAAFFVDMLDKKIDEVINAYINKTIEPYSFHLQYKIEGNNYSVKMDIYQDLFLDKLLDNIYFMIDESVGPYSYLEKWALKEIKTNKILVLKYFQEKVPAHTIFRPNSRWMVTYLDQPWNGACAAYFRKRLIEQR